MGSSFESVPKIERALIHHCPYSFMAYNFGNVANPEHCRTVKSKVGLNCLNKDGNRSPGAHGNV